MNSNKIWLTNHFSRNWTYTYYFDTYMEFMISKIHTLRGLLNKRFCPRKSTINKVTEAVQCKFVRFNNIRICHIVSRDVDYTFWLSNTCESSILISLLIFSSCWKYSTKIIRLAFSGYCLLICTYQISSPLATLILTLNNLVKSLSYRNKTINMRLLVFILQIIGLDPWLSIRDPAIHVINLWMPYYETLISFVL